MAPEVIRRPDGGYSEGYSFVSPSILLSNDNIIGEDSVLDLAQFNIQAIGEQESKENGAQFAVKIVSQRWAGQAAREAQILASCQEHKNIVRLVDVYQDRFHIYLIMELLKGDELLTKIKKSKHFTEAEASRIASKVFSAVRYLHHKNIVHRDLKPENIIFESNEDKADLRLIDFGFARFLTPSPSTNAARPLLSNRPLTTPCYTLHYAAPEVLDRAPGPPLPAAQVPLTRDEEETTTAAEMLASGGDVLPQYNEQCDLWSLGVVIYVMLCGRAPFHARTKYESASDIMRRIRNAEFSFDGIEWAAVSDDAKDLISGLLTINPEERLTVDEAVDHPWLQKTCTSSDATLATPNVLNNENVGNAFGETFRAFLTVNREGFHLSDVNNAPLAQRRRRKQRVSSDDSGYTSSVGTTTAGGQAVSSLCSITPPSSLKLSPATPFQSGEQHFLGLPGSNKKRKLLTLVEELPSATNSANVSSSPPGDGPDFSRLPPAFHNYRESPESIRSTTDFLLEPKMPPSDDSTSN
uniref:Protein kinase domain-containing protein n=1 Tax=Romanomermis culicivorax TaxID=13658 RepID=A0A915IIC2_ROMCU